MGFPQNSIIIEQLKCEYRTNPLGIDTLKPRLSWILHSDIRGQTQTAYQILVSTSKDKLTESAVDLWNSGKVNSQQSIHIEYAGVSLGSRQKCYWKVRVWDKSGKCSDWSDISWWEMALLKEHDWKAIWINDGKLSPEQDEDFYQDDPAPLFRKEFKLNKSVKNARLYITGLGYYEAYLNGERVGDSMLDPAWTNYSKRVYYSTHDVTHQVQKGTNCLSVTLGNGWYNPLPLRMWGRLNLREHLTVGRPRFIAQLEINCTDGSREMIVSDESWRVMDGPMLRNNIYLGEKYDARQEVIGWNRYGLNDKDWRQVKKASEPIGKLQAQPLPPTRVTATLKPHKIMQSSPEIYIVDMGQNFTGWAKFYLKAPQGTKIQFRYGELLYEDGTLNPMTSVCGQIKENRRNHNGEEVSVGGSGSPKIAWQMDTYIAKGDGWEEYVPRFTFHAFRYIEVSGFPGELTTDMVSGLRLNSDIDEVGDFSCSNPMFNAIQNMSRWTFMSNLLSVQSDCPHRERFGYGGDIVSTNEALMFNYNMANFYAKAVQDWADSVLEDGMLTDTAPFVGIQYCGVGWALVHPLLQLNLYRYYGNRRILERQYEVSLQWLDLVQQQYPDYIVSDGLSDHESLTETPSEELVTPLFYYSAKVLSTLATILNRADEAKRFQDLSSRIKSAYLNKFLQKGTGLFSPGSQASQSFALYLDLAPTDETEEALAYLEKNVVEENQGHLTTGIMGTKFMLDVFCRNDLSDIAYGIVNKKTFPGWGFMLENGATTLWEHWDFSDNTFSHNHPMFGSVSQWFYNWLGGIQAAPEAVGFNKIIIRPQIVDDLEWVKCCYNSIRGRIYSNWHKEEKKLFFEIQIPVNTEATVFLPIQKNDTVLESGQPVEKAKGVQLLQKEGHSVIFCVESGKYLFEIRRN